MNSPASSAINATILLLVSDPLVRTVMEETISRAGYTVLASGDLGGAVARLREARPDLLVTRTYVQGMTGHDAAKYLRTKVPGMKVLLVGGLMNDDRLHYRESMEGFSVFPKPYTAEEMLEKVKEVLSNK
jgi:DNA-binding NtrC family response regulator